MAQYAQFDKATGKITAYVVTTEAQDHDGFGYIPVPNGDIWDHYVEDGVLKEKQDFRVILDKTDISADGIDAVSMEGLPVPCEIWVELAGQRVFTFHPADGNVAVTFDTPGEYLVTVSSLMYKTKEITINAV